ncbi:hypothetical protein CSUI_000257 [Cystoisospora suis]|uniref:Uncharacterized protein n=1 Tax=Cystoisospora suis TaxID=483139 RepID=A0A2C6KPG9_9APIC|nr:hypothetical protein CSUI_000257 [Cystoisospora suis]
MTTDRPASERGPTHTEAGGVNMTGGGANESDVFTEKTVTAETKGPGRTRGVSGRVRERTRNELRRKEEKTDIQKEEEMTTVTVQESGETTAERGKRQDGDMEDDTAAGSSRYMDGAK